jgi:hypothetical protein
VTGQYKIVNASSDQDKVQVFVLGQASSWRDVSAPDYARCRLDAGVLALDGAAYWVTIGERILSFDLEDDSVVPIESPPEPICHLAEVRGRLAAVISDGVMAHEKVQVWIFEGEKMERRWNHRYNVQLPRAGLQEYRLPRPGQRLARPHLGHGMSTILTNGTWVGDGLVLYELTPTSSPCTGSAVQNHQWKPRPLDCNNRGRIYGTFAYTETTEPLGDFKLW